jgi:hypothetical protein
MLVGCGFTDFTDFGILEGVLGGGEGAAGGFVRHFL